MGDPLTPRTAALSALVIVGAVVLVVVIELVRTWAIR